jgi:cell fate (sporulation/competence/biofilm development) regulator YlbF (YheA/YmcA/DUF963 family)
MTQIREVGSETLSEEPTWRSEVERAARGLAEAIAETPEFQAFERAYGRLRDDEHAQDARMAYEVQQRSLQPLAMLGAVSDEQRAELERLRQAWMALPAVTDYLEAQMAMAAMCRAIDERLSEPIGLGFAAACTPGCCG